MFDRMSFAAAAAVIFLVSAPCRADDAGDAFQLLEESYRQQTSEELPRDARWNAVKAWHAFEKKGLAQTSDEAPKGALVFYHTPYSERGRLAVSNGDGTVLLGPALKEALAIDTIPGRLGWIVGPRKLEPTCHEGTATVTSTAPLGTPATTTTTATTTPGTTTPGTTTPGTTSTNGSDGLDGKPVTTGKPGTGTNNGTGVNNGTGTNNGTTNAPVSQPVSQPSQPVSQPVSQPFSSQPASPFQNNGGSNNGGSNLGNAPIYNNNSGSGPSNTSAGTSGNPQSYTPDPNFRPTAGSTFVAKGTGYFPENSAMEGGFKDQNGKPLSTLQDFLANRSPFVSVAMEKGLFAYGTKLRIKELEEKYGRQIDFRVVDNGGRFNANPKTGKKGTGTSRIDICTANASASHDATVNGTLHCEVVK